MEEQLVQETKLDSLEAVCSKYKLPYNKIYKLSVKVRDPWSKVKRYQNTTLTFAPGLYDNFGRYRIGELKNDEELQRFFEKAIGLEKGILSPKSNFWREYNIEVGDEGETIDTSLPEGLLRFIVLKDSRHVQNGPFDKKSRPLFYMENEEAIAKVSNNIRQDRAKAYSIYNDMTLNDKIDYLTGTGHNVDDVSPDIIEDKVGADVDANPRKFIDFIDNPNFKDYVFLNKLLYKKLLRETAGQIIIVDSNAMLGHDKESAIRNLNNKKYQQIKISLMAKLNELLGINSPAGQGRDFQSLDSIIGGNDKKETKEADTKTKEESTLKQVKDEVKEVEKVKDVEDAEKTPENSDVETSKYKKK